MRRLMMRRAATMVKTSRMYNTTSMTIGLNFVKGIEKWNFV